jgi:hypothetical protein
VQEYLERWRGRHGPVRCERVFGPRHFTEDQEKNRSPGNKAGEETAIIPHPVRGEILYHDHDLAGRGYFSGPVPEIPGAVREKPGPGRNEGSLWTDMVFAARIVSPLEWFEDPSDLLFPDLLTKVSDSSEPRQREELSSDNSSNDETNN